MKKRGSTFSKWFNNKLHHRSHDELLSDGTCIDVQVRITSSSVTQLFIGVYRGDGVAILEEFYESLPTETMTKALVWGTDRARAFAVTGKLSDQHLGDINK
ncbi:MULTISPECIES: hypothetical protein [Pseudomonas]|uniref:hypothetical protein n=1 Tax=Pseudomonas TaxID=286 RepID=UPI0018E5F2FD|nr:MULTISPECIES: hypothetical protein [Pseudomonas]MBI6655461.1 hypothetical protein [Pseudomonas carnis]MBI6662985.1 hypothetical protein [Pseudomonas carnis]MBI6687375.1 hypothetical protein [Pseudomonas carnis]MBW9247119.1 hypothetical protein [Pseudomonas paracarnis]